METPSAADPPDDEDVSQLDRRVSKAVEEEHAFLEYIASLPAMSSENVEAFKKKESPDLGAHESVGGLETLDNLYKLMEHLGRLRRQNSKLQKRLQYLENADPDCEESTTRSRRFSSKTKTLTRTISKDDATTNVVSTTVKSKVSKWTKVKEAFRWEKASGGVLLPEAASQDSGLGGGDFHLRPPGDRSSYSVSPADSVLSGPPPRLASSLSTSEDELELDLSDCGQKRRTLSLEKNVHLGVDEDETRRSKSLDGESIESAQGINDQPTSHSKENRFSHNSQKVHKTPWSKVKDIIQTRTGSIKKKKGTDNTDADEECPVDALEGEDRDCEYKSFDFVLSEDAMDPSSEVSQRMTNMSNRNKRLAPVLTITLPSTEELRPPDSKAGVSPTPSNKNGKPPPSPQVEEKHNKTLMRQKTMEELPSKDQYKKQVSSSSAGTSPPTPRRKSKWSKVKNAFLTSTPSPEDIAAHFSNSTPSSPVNKCSFLYDLESDELSSSEFIDENLQENNDNVFIEPADDNFNTRSQQMTSQKNLEELHLRFSNEFHQKLSEWERIRNSGIGISSPPSAGKVSASGLSSGTSSVGEEEKRDKRRSEEWDRMKSGRKRESLALQQLGEENLSPDFKKKLEQWERIKAIPVSPTQESSPVLQPQSKKKITDWQRWRPGSSSTKTDNHSHNFPHELPEEFSKRLQDWDRMKHGTSVEVSDASQKPANRTPSPGVSHDVVFEHKSRKIQHRLSETKDKWADTGHKVLKSKSHHEMKELAWLEKELHKIEREKQRLERERDKYLEREARLQKMRRAIGSTQQKQEVVIPTSTGVFRFEGISQKFTKKLYEWEKARGIGPEASTIALLDPGYKPQSDNSISGETLKKNGALLLRSKSMGSVVDIAGGGGCQASVITHQPSSLSLNNMEEIGNTQIIGQDPDSCLSDKEDDYDDYYDGDEPGAVIVDIEDVVEETASPMAEPPAVLTEIPVYCYAPAEVTRLIDSSGSENELSSENVQSSYCILQENIDLLDELKKKEDICRRIEIQMENIEEKIQSTANVRERKLESLSMDEPQMDKLECDPGEDEVTELHDIKSQLKILDDDQEALKQEEETLQYSFAEHSEQQAVLAQSLVDNMRQLQEVNNCMSAKDTPDSPKRSSNDPQEEALAKVQDLTGQLLTMAERLEVIVGERNKELSRLRESISPHNTRRPYLYKHSLSTDSITMSPTTSSVSRLPRQSSEELSQLPTMLTSKVLELKRGLTYLCAVSDAAVKAVSRTCNINDDKPNRKLETDVEPTTISELCQESDGAGAVSIEKMTSHDKDESESELKSNYENNLIVGCLTLPALRFRKDGSKLEFD
ncbi:hypothetical protein LSTR_LSTR008300 [Laodelphax striatellus]|uniref:Uncharacterized protein n=1 Tax=Laodelphax striatellus TaxID=195883 RepID=A0A482XJA1_LAOST|nr:hypothetical protein LSTR_LSTR008300 [Laodelphax striatellus]